MNVNESAGATQLNSDLKAGLRALDRLQEIEFVKYVRLVLPLDGFVFWVKADMLGGSANYNSLLFNTNGLNSADRRIASAPIIKIWGSLHYSTDNKQELDQTIGLNNVIFTSESDIDDFNDIGESVMYIASFNDIQFSFSRRGSFYSQVGLYHYQGEAIHPAMRSQIIDDVRFFDQSQIVSNSLTIFMMLNQFMPVFPSFLVPQNMRPPYAVCDVKDTFALQSAPYVDINSNRWQLVQDNVSITTYGLNNNKIIDYLDYVVNEAMTQEYFGVMNMPVPKDEKRPQTELNVIAQKKIIEIQVNYYQSRIRNIARQLITDVIPTLIINTSSNPFLPIPQNTVTIQSDFTVNAVVPLANNTLIAAFIGNFVALENIKKGSPVYISRANGKIGVAKGKFYTQAFVVGYAVDNINSGYSGDVAGEICELSDWSQIAGTTLLSTGQSYFLNDIGGITLNIPDNNGYQASTFIGTALNSKTLEFRPTQPLLL